VTMTLFAKLEAEWRELGGSVSALNALRIWAQSDPSLDPFDDLHALVRFVQRSPDRAQAEELLACLAARAPSDPLAARTLLQVVFYGLVRIAADFRSVAHSDEDAASMVVATAYERICTYPIERRPRSIAPNILLDTRQGVSRSLFRPRVAEDPTANVWGVAIAAPPASAADQLLGLVDEAVRTRKLRVDDARLIVLTRVAGVTTADLAAEHGCAPQSLRRRLQRAEATLVSAVKCVA
jgi:DNA-directed RNA polymerase specialized sigma24 family protein